MACDDTVTIGAGERRLNYVTESTAQFCFPGAFDDNPVTV